MTTATEYVELKKKIELYEGNIDHMCLDSNGFVTVGVGHMVPNASKAAKLTFYERVSHTTARGEPWSAVEEVHLVEQGSAAEARFRGNASEQSLVIVGQGDVNGDGLNDLVLLSRGRLTEGSLKSTRLFVLTQGSPTEPTMRVLP